MHQSCPVWPQRSHKIRIRCGAIDPMHLTGHGTAKKIGDAERVESTDDQQVDLGLLRVHLTRSPPTRGEALLTVRGRGESRQSAGAARTWLREDVAVAIQRGRDCAPSRSFGQSTGAAATPVSSAATRSAPAQPPGWYQATTSLSLSHRSTGTAWLSSFRHFLER